ncbi:AAA family ATPase [Actinocrispum wychmicini]|uniref:MoxR-like ATPase n=1 Tax=Actinocrispum wychmicini TaxID=1213861 RepID=A0A4R2J3D0_9PSEU|nr:MoxR family ATPase [Actinocrispum wychmicini]TCO52943.1 MoxR-like ATPase [Actinocrispum wychmicini]
MTGHTDHDQLIADGESYLPSADLSLAVRVAMAIGRPLLLYGEPGSGKSTLARHVAVDRGMRYYEHVTTARTGAQDLLWTFDHVRRLGDAQADRLDETDNRYVTPGVLWWAFRRDLADPVGQQHEPFEQWNSDRKDAPAVVLVDEIDKADPDMPNGLLAPLAARRFVATEYQGGVEVAEHPSGTTLVIITSNEERDLPQAFVRRCVVHRLPPHGREDLKLIAEQHLLRRGETIADEFRDHLLDELEAAREVAKRNNQRMPSTAEFLDAVNACVRLELDAPANAELARLLGMIFTKDTGGR